MRPINLIVIHCSASPNSDTLFRGEPGKRNFQNPAQVIDSWHMQRGFHRDYVWRQRQNPGLQAIGYHYVIGRDGQVMTGRHVDEIGAHAQGFNQKSLGICLVGIDAFTPAQYDNLGHLITAEVALLAGANSPADRQRPLSRQAAVAWAKSHGVTICGHRDLPKVHKSCPGFDVAPWLEGGMS